MHSKAFSTLRRLYQWAAISGVTRLVQWSGHMVVIVAPTELSEKQRFVLKTMVEQHATPQFIAIFAASLLDRSVH